MVTRETETSPAFVLDAIEFRRRYRRAGAFRLLKFFTRCSEAELDLLLGRIYCSSLPGATRNTEGRFLAWFGLAFLPLTWLAGKKFFWRGEPSVKVNFETPNEDYFRTKHARVFAAIHEMSRLTPRNTHGFSGLAISEPVTAALRARSLFLLVLLGPVMIVLLGVIRLRAGINLLSAYRGALSEYALFDAYFARYPCEHFVTYADDSNHPSRYIAFRQQCRGLIMAIQNGDRTSRPTIAFGALDVYFVFGDHYAELMRRLGAHIDRYISVGSLSLNERHAMVMAGDRSTRFDVLYIDNGSLCPPDYGGLIESVATSELQALRNLGRYLEERPALRAAYQLRPYAGNHARKREIIAIVRECIPRGIEILDNSGGGDSYLNITRSRLVITFQSTMGFEALTMGVNALFINYSGYASETLCEDERFQLDDREASYPRFADKVDRLLRHDLGHVPAAAQARHCRFDGRVQEAIAEALVAIIRDQPKGTQWA